jgi:hypothetical protein
VTLYTPAELAHALAQALRQARPPLDTGDVELTDLDAYFTAGQRVGLGRPALQAALDAVAQEKARRGKRAPSDDTGNPTFRVTTQRARDLLSPHAPALRRTTALIAGAGLAVAALIVIGLAVALQPGPAASVSDDQTAATRPSSDAVAGSIDVEAFRASLEPLRNKVRTCAKSDFNRLALQLSIGLSARIGLDGKASNVKIVNDPLDSPPVRTCVEKELAAYEFPKPKDAPVDVDFQLAFDANPNALKNKKPSK